MALALARRQQPRRLAPPLSHAVSCEKKMTQPFQIETSRLILRPPRSDDAEAAFAAWTLDSEVTKYLTWKPHKSIDDTREHLVRVAKGWADGGAYFWFITLDGSIVGSIALRIEGFKADLGYVIARAYWNRGVATEALKAVLAYGLSMPSIHRIWAVCDVDNVASARVMEKAGMQKEGILRKWILHPQVSDTPRDCYCYSIIRGSQEGSESDLQ